MRDKPCSTVILSQAIMVEIPIENLILSDDFKSKPPIRLLQPVIAVYSFLTKSNIKTGSLPLIFLSIVLFSMDIICHLAFKLLAFCNPTLFVFFNILHFENIINVYDKSKIFEF